MAQPLLSLGTDIPALDVQVSVPGRGCHCIQMIIGTIGPDEGPKYLPAAHLI